MCSWQRGTPPLVSARVLFGGAGAAEAGGWYGHAGGGSYACGCGRGSRTGGRLIGAFFATSVLPRTFRASVHAASGRSLGAPTDRGGLLPHRALAGEKKMWLCVCFKGTQPITAALLAAAGGARPPVARAHPPRRQCASGGVPSRLVCRGRAVRLRTRSCSALPCPRPRRHSLQPCLQAG